MPTTNNPVNFHFINNTPPSTYDNNTIYFDSINGNIKVGNINIAEKNHLLQLEIYSSDQRIIGNLDGTNFNRITLGEILNLKQQFGNSLKIEFLYWEDNVKTILPLVQDYLTFLYFEGLNPPYNKIAVFIRDEYNESLDLYEAKGEIEFILPEEPILTITIPIPVNTIISSSGTVITNSTVKNNYNNYASSSTFWTELRNTASSGKNITIISTEEDEVMYKFNNYYYQIGSGDYLNFSLIINNNNLTEIYSVEFNMSNEIITLFNKSLTI